MKTKIIKYILVFAIMLSGFASWFSIDRAVNVSDSSTWLVPIIWFSIFFINLSLGAIIINDKKILFSALALSFFSSLIFTFSFWYFGILLISFFVAGIAVRKISNDLELNIKISLTKSIRTGKVFLILALALASSSQYYFETKDTPLANIIPKFETREITAQILPMIYPNFKNDSQEELTVDEFLLEMSSENSDNILSGFLSDSKTSEVASMIGKEQMKEITLANQEMILKEGRKNLEDIVGRDITGQEKMSDVFSDMISARMNEIFSSALARNEWPMISALPASILFLTIISLGPFLGFLAIYAAVFIFWLFKVFGLVKISKEMKEVEVVE